MGDFSRDSPAQTGEGFHFFITQIAGAQEAHLFSSYAMALSDDRRALDPGSARLNRWRERG